MLEMAVTDLDGTILNSAHKISEKDIETLNMLGEHNICRVIATGRSLFSVNELLLPDIPFDYLIFSSGAGIMNWSERKIILDYALQKAQIRKIAEYLINNKLDFMLHRPVPDNHHFLYHRNGPGNPDFKRRLELNKPFARQLTGKKDYLKKACQFIAIINDHRVSYEKIHTDLEDFKVIRTTSPLDKKTLWVEIFPKEVSKSSASAWLCKKLKIDPVHTLGLGNDYNDLDLLNWAGHSYVVGNAPSDLKSRFTITSANDDSAFSAAVFELMNKLGN